MAQNNHRRDGTTARRRLLLPVVIAALLAFAGPAAAGSEFAVTGATVTPPAASGWTVVRTDAEMVRFENLAEGEVAEVAALTTPSFASNADFLGYAEQWKTTELTRWEMLSVHFNYRAYKNVPCVAYDGIFKDAAAADATARIRTFGYVCKHPDIAGAAIDISFARSAADDAMPDASMALGAAFIDSLTFKQTAQ